MPISYTFQQDECPSFGGASLSKARIPVILKIEEYVRSLGDNNVTGIDIQRSIDHNENDTRSLISVMRKLNLINMQYPIEASRFFTGNGKAYIHTLRALQSIQEGSEAYNLTIKALQLILQDGIWYHYNTTDNTRLGIYIILNIIGKTNTLSFNEYCFALSESNEGKYDFKRITNEILNNRDKHIEYSFKKKRRTNTKDALGNYIIAEVDSFDTVLQSTREFLQQAGILVDDTTDCELKDRNFLKKHNLPI